MDRTHLLSMVVASVVTALIVRSLCSRRTKTKDFNDEDAVFIGPIVIPISKSGVADDRLSELFRALTRDSIVILRPDEEIENHLSLFLLSLIDLFGIPIKDKMGVHKKLIKPERGYFEVCSEAEEFDVKEGFDMAMPVSSEGFIPECLGTNAWPHADPGKKANQLFTKICPFFYSIATSIVTAIEVGLELPKGKFTDAFSRQMKNCV